MPTSRAVIVFLILNLACQTKSQKGTEAVSAPEQADSTALLTKRPGPDAPRSAADRLVRALYFEHNKTDNPFREKTSRALIDQFFTGSVADAIWNNVQKPATSAKSKTSTLLFNAPDAGIHKTWVEPAAVAGSRAVVYVTFENRAKAKEIRLDLQQKAGRWRITEMHYPDGTRLTQLLR